MSDQSAIRTRFAPSPTGYLHVGGIRTALFAWLVAKQAGGQFILRLEDTDQVREVSGSAEHIIESLRALGLDYQEGPDIGGSYGPYKQSERLDIYKQWADKLVASGQAYADPYTPAQLQEFRDQAKAQKRPFLFRDYRPDSPPEWDGSQPLRLRSQPKVYKWQDAVMGQLSAGPEAVDDFILIKSDGFPTYNFAHIIDDYLMKISHVIRSQEFLASVPKYLNLYETLDIKPPIMATVPPVMAPGGNRKLSKRDGAKDVLDYIKEGYLPEALNNFIASLGWNDGTEQEIYSMDELIQKFSLDHVQKSGANFDERRLLWMSGAHIRQLPLTKLYQEAADFWPPEAKDYPEEYKKAVLGLSQERLKFLAELPSLTGFFFTDLPADMELLETKQLKKLSNHDRVKLLNQALTSLQDSDFTAEDLQERLNQLLEATEQKPAVLFSLIRVATTWAPASPGLADTLHVLGKKKSLQRLQQSIATLDN